MNIAPTDISAAARSAHASKQRRGLAPKLARLLVAGAVLAGVAVSVPAAAIGDRDQRDQRDRGDQRDHGDQRGDQRERPHPQQQPQPQPREPQREQPQQRADARQFDTRAYDMRLDEARRQQAQQQQDTGGRRGGRLTPDERRELRRQINEAGMDLYPNTPRR